MRRAGSAGLSAQPSRPPGPPDDAWDTARAMSLPQPKVALASASVPATDQPSALRMPLAAAWLEGTTRGMGRRGACVA